MPCFERGLEKYKRSWKQFLKLVTHINSKDKIPSEKQVKNPNVEVEQGNHSNRRKGEWIRK